MSVIEGKELKPCKELYTEIEKFGEHKIDLMSHCNHQRFQLGCLDGNGDCPDYKLSLKIGKEIRGIASQIEARK